MRHHHQATARQRPVVRHSFGVQRVRLKEPASAFSLFGSEVQPGIPGSAQQTQAPIPRHVAQGPDASEAADGRRRAHSVKVRTRSFPGMQCSMVVVMLPLLASALIAVTGPTLMVTATAARVRAGPTAEAEVIARLPFGAEVIDVGRQGPWVHVKAPPALDGYLANELIVVLPDGPEARIAAQLKAVREKFGRKLTWNEYAELLGFLAPRAEGSGPSNAVFALLQVKLLAEFTNRFNDEKTTAWIVKTYPGLLAEDYAQGSRVSYDAAKKISDALTGKPASEEADSFLLDIGVGGECEGDVSCTLMALEHEELRYLRRQPQGKERASVFRSANNVLRWALEQDVNCGEAGESRRVLVEQVKETRASFAALPRSTEATTAVEMLDELGKVVGGVSCTGEAAMRQATPTPVTVAARPQPSAAPSYGAIQTGRVGEFKIGGTIEELSVPSPLELKREVETRFDEEGERMQAVASLMQGAETLLTIDLDGRRVHEIRIASSRYKTDKGMGVGSGLDDFAKAYPVYEIAYTYISGMICIEVPALTSVQFLIDEADFTGDRKKMECHSDWCPLTRGDLRPDAKIKGIRLF